MYKHLKEDEASDNEDGGPSQSDELSFVTFLNKVIEQLRKMCRSNPVHFKQKNLVYNVQLLLVFIVFVAAIIIGATFLNKCNDERMTCIFLIVHGTFGLVVVAIHIFTAVVK